ncbi:MAG: carbamoyl-phosphate synthase large subunit [Candidatus Levybacteria bacterium]|nr:carbamoyl-phosphate synthase large subunit [Candidatus Levybacteria bacterium]
MQYKKVLILGSGALKIGEAGEFDYSGSQAIKALKEEGIQTILVNPNIATIQTSSFLADTIYFLPVTPDFVTRIIEKEKPDGILLSFGGQTALNCGMSLHNDGVLKKYGVAVLGSPVSAVIITEDRQKFADHLAKIGVTTPPNHAATSPKQAIKIAKEMGFPVMIRSGFALGGQGSGIAQNTEELTRICEKAFAFVPQILVEKYLHHYKEVEYEVVRDKDDNCVTVCNMENMDPLGIHTGESIVIAPSQTLTNYEYHTLRTIAIKIVRSLGIVGECNVQFALSPKPSSSVISKEERLRDPKGISPSPASLSIDGRSGPRAGRNDIDPPFEYYVIELNARLSRSSALASKATGYPLAYVAAKLALGKNLTSLQNKVTKATQFCFEPALDYVTVKIPRWDINKFQKAEETIGSSMKSVGEVMGIGRTFEEAYQKAVRMLDLEFEGTVNEQMLVGDSIPKEETVQLLKKPTPHRMFLLSKAFYQGISIDAVYKATGIDPWFLYRINNIVNKEKEIKQLHNKQLGVIANGVKQSHTKKIASSTSSPRNDKGLTKELLLHLKQLGFSDKRIGMLVGKTGLDIRLLRKKHGILPSVFQIDTLAGEFPAKTNYLYMTYNGHHNDVKPTKKKGVMVLGSGPYRIGSSVEFDWTTVNTATALKRYKKQSIMINCNPETVSTDYDISDRLYFEELTFERIADIYDFEKPYGVIISVGGQTPNNRANALKSYGCKILGTDPKNIDKAENRNKFSALLDKLQIAQPEWATFTDFTALQRFCDKVGYPVLIRPSYVLSGAYMRISHTHEELVSYIEKATLVSPEYPITVSKFIEDAKEIELDGVAHKGKLLQTVISEHVENAGVHSGDATIVLPPQKVYVQTMRLMEDIAKKLAQALTITGPFNIQFLAKDNNVSVIEINVRASRTFPFISKVTGVNYIDLAVDAFFNNPPKKVIQHPIDGVAVKVAQFSFSRITGADPILHVEMSSTGEVACFGEDVEEAFLKGELAVGGKIPAKGIFISIGGDENKTAFLESAKRIASLQLPLYATEKTAAFLKAHKIKAKRLHKIFEKHSPTVLEYFHDGKVDLAINISETGSQKAVTDGYLIRRNAIDNNIPLYTDLKKAELFIKAITTKPLDDLLIKSWDEYL